MLVINVNGVNYTVKDQDSFATIVVSGNLLVNTPLDQYPFDSQFITPTVEVRILISAVITATSSGLVRGLL